MKRFVWGLVLAGAWVAGFGAAGGHALAQAPTSAPAGAMGICKDGTYSMQATKQGACRGHKGVQTWYAASAPSSSPSSSPSGSMPAPTSAVSAPAAMPAPKQVQSVPSRPAPVLQTAPVNAVPAPASPVTSTGKRLSPAQAAAQKTAVPGGGPGLVWVNTESKVYHCNGDTFYGKTKAGQYMSESAAQAQGAHGARNKTCTGK